jgi:tetratricopeptide (TPR) repeat protein
VQIRVGLNSGEVIVGAIGSDLRMDYTAVGQTTHLAARMEQMARPGSVLITGDTLKLGEGYVQVRPLGAVPVKGLEVPTPVYELTGSVPARSRPQASAARGLTRFVGRDTELQQLGRVLERAAVGHGQAVAVVGEAGVGKSRLAWEFARSHRTRGWLVLESGSVSYGKGTPYLPVIELLKAYCRIQERDEPREIRERVAGKLLTLDRALLAGRREDALATAGRGLTLARERGHRVAEAWALRLLAEIVSRPNAPDVETAEGHYRQALALAHELGMRPLEAHCHFGLGELHRRTGERAKAAQHLATARAMYHEMGMDFWLAKAETARTTAS